MLSMVCISSRIAAIDGRSSVYSPLRRGLAGVRLEEADEMLGIIEAEKGADLGYRKHF